MVYVHLFLESYHEEYTEGYDVYKDILEVIFEHTDKCKSDSISNLVTMYSFDMYRIGDLLFENKDYDHERQFMYESAAQKFLILKCYVKRISLN